MVLLFIHLYTYIECIHWNRLSGFYFSLSPNIEEISSITTLCTLHYIYIHFAGIQLVSDKMKCGHGTWPTHQKENNNNLSTFRPSFSQ